MKKRAASLFLSISMMIGLLSVSFAAGSQFADDNGSGNWTWASDYIYACSDAGILNGYTDSTFRIDNNLTRVEAAAIIARAYGLTSDADESTFSDVSSDHWGLQYIEACVEAGVINGYGDGTFRPGNYVTRAEMAKMIASVAALTASGSACFRDDDGTGSWAWASEYIYACYAAGILNGYTNGDFLPANSITRGEASKMIAIAAGLAEGTAASAGQLEALSAAEVLLETYILSFDDLVSLLTDEEGYTQSEAVYAAVNCGADWNEEALWAAEYLLEYGIFSETALETALIDDLQFTSAQALYALTSLDADWNEEAARGAAYWLSEDPLLSYDELVALLTEEMGFTASQAASGANAAGVYQ